MRPIYRLCFLLPFLVCFSFSNAQITADFTMDKTGGCSPLSLAFTAQSLGTSPNASYSWDLGNGNTSVLKNPSAIYLQEKIYTVRLTVTNGTQTATKTKTITVYKKPVVDFSVAAPKVCLPQGVQFTSTASAGDGSITGWQWDFGDGSTQQSFSNGTTHNYGYEITPAVSLTVTNSFGCVASRTKADIVEVLSKMEPLFTVNKTMLCNLGETIQLTNTSTGPGTLFYLWNFGDGTTSTAKNPVHQYSQKGVYQVRLTVSNTVGCSVTSSPVSVNAANFKTDFSTQLLCRQAKFSGSSFIFPSSSAWAFGDGGTSTSYSNTSHTYAAAGDYNVRLINTYNTCKDTVIKSIAVQNLVNFNSGITMPATICKGTSANFTSTSTVAPGLMSWNFGDGANFTTSFNNVTHTYSQPGTYTVTLQNTFGTCSETVTKTIVVNDLPTTTGFITDFGGVCGSPVTVTFRDTTPGAVGWQWWMDYNSFNSPFSSSQTAPYRFSSDGYHLVYLNVTNAAGCSRMVSKQVNVFSPSASIFITQSSSPKSNYDCDSLTIKLAVNSNQPIKSYSWNFGNGATSTLPDPQVSYNQIGVYNVVLNYITESGCPGTAVFFPRVYGKPKADFGYTIPCGNSLELHFYDTSPFFIDEWNWKFGDGGAAFWQSPDHVYKDTGVYNVTFINKIGHCSDTIVKPVYANVLPSSISIIKAENTCDGTRGTVTFDQRSVRASGGTWDFGDGTTAPYDSSVHVIKHTYTATGSYLVRLTSSYRNCTYTATRSVYILLKQAPVLTANLAQLCANSSLNVQVGNLVVNPFQGNGSWYQYNINKFEYGNGAAFTGSMSNYDFQYTSYTGTLQNFTAGTSAMRVIVAAGGTTCLDTSNYINIQVNGPIAGFRIVNNNSCYKSPFIFVDTSRSSTATPLTTWRWDLGDGTIINNTTGAQVTHSYSKPGTYFVRLTVTDATGCSKTVTATANARGTKGAFTTSGLFVPNVPLNTTVSFFNNSISSNSNPTYTWYYGDGATSTNYNGSHTYTIPGVYTVLLIASDPSIPCADTAKQVITVKDFNTAFTFTKSFLSGSSCPPVLVRINNLSVGFNRLLWDFGDGTTSTQNFPSHTYFVPGLYRITLKTYGFNGLSGTYIDSILITQSSVQLSADVLKGCISQQVALGATAHNGVSYLWDFGDGNVTTSATVGAHPYLSPGIFNPRLIVKDATGCAASTQLADSIIIDSLAIAIKGIPSLICDSALLQFAPDVQSFSAAKLGTLLQYKWDFGTGNPADTSNIKNAAFRYTTPGTYNITFTVTSPYGCSRQTKATVIVNQKAKGTINAITESCEQSSVQFAGAATSPTDVQWAWNFGNGATSTQQIPAPQLYAVAGTYAVTLTVTKNGCVDSSIHQLVVHPKPVVNALPRNAVVCLGNSLLLSANGGGSYSWTPGGSLSNSSIASPTARPQASTIYNVQVTSGKGCINKDSITVTVAQPIDVKIDGVTDLCKGLSVQLNASGATSYQWINNTVGLNNTTIKNPLAAPLSTTTYNLVGSDAYNCFKDTASITIAVHNLPTVNVGPDVQIQGGLPYQLPAVASTDVTGWLWSPGDDLSCVDCPSPIATPKMETAYVVKVNNPWGCVAYDTVLVKLYCAIANVHIPDAFTPNNDGRNDKFYIRGSGVKIIHYLRIYDRWGGVIFEKHKFGIDDQSSAWDGFIKGEPVSTGTYVYVTELECSSGERFIRKGSVTVIR